MHEPKDYCRLLINCLNTHGINFKELSVSDDKCKIALSDLVTMINCCPNIEQLEISGWDSETSSNVVLNTMKKLKVFSFIVDQAGAAHADMLLSIMRNSPNISSLKTKLNHSLLTFLKPESFDHNLRIWRIALSVNVNAYLLREFLSRIRCRNVRIEEQGDFDVSEKCLYLSTWASRRDIDLACLSAEFGECFNVQL